MLADSRYLPLKDQSVTCIITSPPYWSLRKYDIPDLIWDGEERCDHEWGNEHKIKKTGGTKRSTLGIPSGGHGMTDAALLKTLTTSFIEASQGQFCLHCSAWRGQLGLEPTIDLYLKHLLQIMDECKRVLRDDGTMWVDIGDSYCNDRLAYKMDGDFSGTDGLYQRKTDAIGGLLPKRSGQGIPSKSLCLIPERFAIEMINRGWILRNKIIWHKPNCMPASVKDRFTVDFEPIFFFVKSKKYWFEQQYEPMTFNRWSMSNEAGSSGKPVKYEQGAPGQSPHSFQREGHSGYFRKDGTPLFNPQGRNMRTVWTIPTTAYSEAHFATFPEALIEPMIRAGCPKGGVVLDPFCGSGTTMRMAEKLNRIGVGFDLAYETLQDKRLSWVQKELLQG